MHQSRPPSHSTIVFHQIGPTRGIHLFQTISKPKHRHVWAIPDAPSGALAWGRRTLEEGGGEGIWVPKIYVPKLARSDFPDCKFRFLPRWSLWSGGGGGRGGACPAVVAVLMSLWPGVVIVQHRGEPFSAPSFLAPTLGHVAQWRAERGRLTAASVCRVPVCPPPITLQCPSWGDHGRENGRKMGGKL